MPRSKAIKIDNDLTKGLITEYTALNFPENACTETDNCVFDALGVVSRRKGIDYEEGNQKNSLASTSTEAYTEYLWTGVAGDGTKSLLVQQKGDTLYFYDVSDNVTPSANIVATSFDISLYLPAGSTYDPGTEPCSYTQGDGKLFIANKYTYPFWLHWDWSSPGIDDHGQITIKYRDFEGVEDSWQLTERKTTDVAGLRSTYPEHYYNLFNQSWATSDALAQWDSARTDVPSNADYVGLFRLSETDAFDPNKVAAKSSLDQRRAPQGHFLLELGNVSRSGAASAEGFAVNIADEVALLTPGSYTTIGNYTNPANAYDGTTAVASGGAIASHAGAGGTTGYIGKDFGVGGKRIAYGRLYGSSDTGFSTVVGSTQHTIRLYGNNSLPANSTDGTLLATATFLDSSDESAGRYLSVSNSGPWRYVWFRVTSDTNAIATVYVGEARFYELTATPSFIRPESIAWYAGRLWFAGPQTDGLASNLYFTQIIQRVDQYGRCYQNNDPTNEYFADLLADDGGVIRIPEMGVIRRLFTFQDGLMVLASNGVWLIRGASGKGFAANDYRVRNITSIGVDSPMSVINFKGTPMWWGKEGIYAANYNPQYDSYDVQSLTLTTIDTFFNAIPALNRKYVKGVFSIYDNVAYWIFNDNENLTAPDYFVYNKVLVYDGASKAFYPWTISTGANPTPKVRGLALVVDPSNSAPPAFKFTTTEYINASQDYVTYSEFWDQNYVDWATLGLDIDYSSYFKVGYRIHGETQKFFQTNYVMVFLNTEANSSCFMQGIWDFTNSGNSGKWSTPQQAYRPSLLYRNINHSRLKVRGKGKALQIKFYSESGKPFNIIGFSCNESVNGDI